MKTTYLKVALLGAMLAVVAVHSYGQDIEKGVVINGITWATRNVDEPGTFATKPEAYGKFYQWNRKTAWTVTGETVSGWDSSTPSGDSWETANDPSPAGWRVPTSAEIDALLDTTQVSRVWTTKNGVSGSKFTDKTTGTSLFLPAGGSRHGSDGTLNEAGKDGYYWSSAVNGTYSAYDLSFWRGNKWYSGTADRHSGNRLFGLSVRSIKAE
jgi:uncharacterized protein (TIGR02145 family)